MKSKKEFSERLKDPKKSNKLLAPLIALCRDDSSAERIQKGLRVKECITLHAEHEGKELTFHYPFSGPDVYHKVRNKLTSQGLVMPTMAQTASLVHAVWQNPKNKYSSVIAHLLRNTGLCTSNGIFYVPNRGAYIQDDPKIEHGCVSMNLSELERKFKEGNSSVRFVKFGYKTGYQTVSEFSKNSFVRGLAGKEGTKKLAEVFNKYGQKPYVRSYDQVHENIKCTVYLYSNWVFSECFNWVGINGDADNRSRSFAFGVKK